MAKYGPSGENKDKDKDDGGIFGAIKRGAGGALGATLNVLDKPGQAVRVGLRRTAKAAYEGEGLGALDNFFSGAAAGLSGRDHASATDVVDSFDARMGNQKKLPFGVDTAVSVALDPTAYLSLGATQAAKQGLKVAGRELGEEVVEESLKRGTRKAISGDARERLRNALIRDAEATGTKNAARTADRQLRAMDRSARGGLKFAGRSVPGLTAESTVGKAAAKVSPRRAGKAALQSTAAGRTVRSAFIRGSKVEDELGPDIANALRRETTAASDTATLKQATTERAAQNLARSGGLISDPERVGRVTEALDINPAVQQARKDAAATVREATKAVREADRLAGRADEIEAGVREALTAKRQVVEDAKDALEMVSAKYGTPDYDPAAVRQALGLVKAAQRDLDKTALRFAESSTRQGVSQMARHAARDADSLVRKADEAVNSIPEHTKESIAKMRGAGDDSLADVTEFADNLRKRITDEQDAAGLLVKGAHETEEYVPRYFTKKGSKWLEANKERVADAMSTPSRKVVSSELKRAIHQGETAMRKLRPDLGLDGLNKMARELGFKGDLVEDNALSALVRRAHSADAAVEHVKMIERVAKMTGPDGEPLLREIPAGAKPSNGRAALDLVDDAGVRYEGDPVIIDMLNEARAITVNDDALRAFAGVTDGISRIWRSMATFGPAFHARNEAGNIWLNYLAGVRNPIYYARAGRLQKAAREAFGSLGKDADIDAAIRALDLPDADKVLLKGALDNGVVTHGFFAEDLVRTPVTLGGKRSAKDKVLLPLVKANKANKDTGSFFENNARLAHYIAKVDELGDPLAATESVKKFLFDYGDLTPFEKHLKKVVPFYTFMRKNTPLQIEQAFTNPGKFTRYAHLSADAEEHGVDYQPETPLKSLDGVSRIVTGAEQEGNRTTSPWQNRFQALVGPVTPLIKTPIELGTGASSYNGYPLRTAEAKRSHALRNALPPIGKVDAATRNDWRKSLLGFENTTKAPDEDKASKRRTPTSGGRRSKYGPK